MTWDDNIEAATGRLRSHLACRHFTSWGNRPIIDGRRGINLQRVQHYWGARRAIKHIREYRRKKNESRATTSTQPGLRHQEA